MSNEDYRYIHIDPCGGVAGDMMLAALLDAFPEFLPELEGLFSASPLREVAVLRVHEDNDRRIRGLHANVKPPKHEHIHRSFSDIRNILRDFPALIKERASDIFHRIAVAEARIHGVSIDSVHFHEVGAWDSIADIVGVSFLIERAEVQAWSSGILPLGAGSVETAHGILPVPAPATLEILRGCEIEVGGPEVERVTPTGAAIIAHLAPTFCNTVQGRLMRIGTGLGKKRGLRFINAVRLFVLQKSHGAGLDEQVGVIVCEIDDQTPEDLAIALEHIRAIVGVLDVIQNPAIGKKGRAVIQLQVLTEPSVLETVISSCFNETTSLGVRYALQSRRVLPRRAVEVGSANVPLRAKIANRPHDETIKVEADDLASIRGHSARQVLRAEHEHRRYHEQTPGHDHEH
ncbi:hypothetical protein B5K11_28930 [Rhizobium leguminosarum bv. trifolii]|uniref:LarC family nickel insertion protein n=1 Tax=Rhizobium leguminosarum TaxID=384 RepID=UPI000E2E795A|nr:LarC family nickel insertion protein [Rhizobium leguminosarum]RFB86085.1 hypothetical protein B5K11_28930 [Rhizobium leguminosarum bv. trifolii]